jgi:hypothetical protein
MSSSASGNKILMVASTNVHNSSDLPAPPTAEAVLPASLEINNKHVTNAQDVGWQGVLAGKKTLSGRRLGHMPSFLPISWGMLDCAVGNGASTDGYSLKTPKIRQLFDLRLSCSFSPHFFSSLTFQISQQLSMF